MLVGLQVGTITLENSLAVFQLELTEDPAKPFLGIYPVDVPTCKKDKCSTMFIAALFIIEVGKNLPVPHRGMETKCGTFTQWNTTQILKTMNS